MSATRISKRIRESDKPRPVYKEESLSLINAYSGKRRRKTTSGSYANSDITTDVKAKLNFKTEIESKPEVKVKIEQPEEESLFEQIVKKNIETRERLFKELNIGQLAQVKSLQLHQL